MRRALITILIFAILGMGSVLYGQVTPQPLVKPKLLPGVQLERLPPKPDVIEPVAKKALYRSVSSPRWNLSGSWSRIRDRTDLINHLAETHQYSRATLNQMSIGMLWARHDDDHEGRATLSKAKAVKTEEYCPPGGT